MILIWMLGILLIGGVLAWISERWGLRWPRRISLIAIGADFFLALLIWLFELSQTKSLPRKAWYEQIDLVWVSSFGIHLHLAMDGLSLLLLLLTFFLGMMGVLASWKEIRTAVGFFHFNFLWTLAGVAGEFLAMDLFLFYFAWELMLIPMYFIIAVWGHERRADAAVKFFIFTQLSGLLMLVAILALYMVHHNMTGQYSFDYQQLLATRMDPRSAFWIMLGFWIAFAVKLPVVPFHSWLPDAHTEAPTAGSVILAGLLLKTGAYGLLRFAIPLFPAGAREAAFMMMILGIIGILYGAILAFAQSDLKRLVAYTSVSHMGFVLLGLYTWNTVALQGVLLLMICHGISTGALFILAGFLQERLKTREIHRMGGLWTTIPRLSGATLFFALGAMGLPGLGDFVGEFLILLGASKVSIVLTVLAAVGIPASALYALKLVQYGLHGPNIHHWEVPDLVIREAIVVAPLMVSLLWLGLYPQPVFKTFRPAMVKLQKDAAGPVKNSEFER